MSISSPSEVTEEALRSGLHRTRSLSLGPRSVHFQDLVALSPTGPELEDATAWVAAQDPSLAHTLAQVVAHVQHTR